MPPPRTTKIDLTQEYPCPCRQRGHLRLITLTEAFGCDRCQQIFVVDETGYVLEQLSSHYPYKRSWRWNGHQWHGVRSSLRESYLPMTLGVILVLLSVLLPLALNSPPSSGVIFWAIVALLLAVLPVLMILLAYRR